MALRYFFQVDLNGQPIQGSNTVLIKRPITGGKGQRWVEYIPAAKAQPCCPSSDTVKITSLHKSPHFYVRLSEVTSLPISGTLSKHKNRPPNYFWQEIIGKYQCATTPQFNATFSTKGGTNTSVNILTAMGLDANEYTLLESGSKTTSGSAYTFTAATTGALTSIAGSGTGAITLHYVSNGCNFAFQLTITA